jgi:hypothetical protein
MPFLPRGWVASSLSASLATGLANESLQEGGYRIYICRLGQVKVVHFTAVLTAISQGFVRTPNEELRASSAGVNKHQPAFLGNIS